MNVQATNVQVSTPCVKLCKIDPPAGVCSGCLRTLAEIRDWGGMSEAQRLAVMRVLASRPVGTTVRTPP
jgi:predicted Fe-S protein YdhL (DUF1289 family)